MQNLNSQIKQLILTTVELDSATYKDINMSEMKFNSIEYIKIIVAIEREFEMEFDDECLLQGYFPTFEALVDYVEAKKNN